ncbi:MAG: preprotein translocase subunit YajC [Oscillospiraceae bacterium]|nr:preprotein translocase subunit YajC [Oscillospiraceae bacterium]
MTNLFLLTATADGATGSLSSTLISFLPFVLILVAFYFILIRPQKKKEKKDAEMRKSVQIGDELVTIGGIVGIVCKLEEDTLVIETGSDKSKIRIKRWAISQNLDAEKEAKTPKAVETTTEENK